MGRVVGDQTGQWCLLSAVAMDTRKGERVAGGYQEMEGGGKGGKKVVKAGSL